MTDMTAFERRVADGMLHRAGPVRPVDDLAVFESVTAASRSQTWGFTMFSALKFIAAGVIVALFGGFLLAGVLTTPNDDQMVPAAVTESPSPMTTEELLSGMVTEEVEPGVLRVVNDGVRDLLSANNQDIVAGHDGGIWLARKNRLLRLGSESAHEWPDDRSRESPALDFDVAADGTVWAMVYVGGSIDRKFALDSYDGTRWRTHERLPHGRGAALVEAGGDGMVWVESWYFGMLGPEGWQDFEQVVGGYLSVLEDGTPVLLTLSDDGPESETVELIVRRFDDGSWQDWRSVELDGEDWYGLWSESGAAATIGPDGTVWGVTYPAGVVDDDGTWVRHTRVLRLDGNGTREWGPAEGVPDIHLGWPHVSPDGSAWGTRGHDDGVARFDGETWSQYLAGHTILRMDIAADGSVWVLAHPGPFEQGHKTDLYVITPEAVAASE